MAVSPQYPGMPSGRLVSESQPAEDSLAMQEQDICTFGDRENLEQLQPTGLIIIVVWLRSSLISNSLDFKRPDGSRACKHQV